MLSATPLRALGERGDDGLTVLSDPGLQYADGAEDTLARIVGGAQDRSSTSDELAAAATDWATTYSLTPVRANLLRGVDLRPGMKVLEIGGGCGPITRYLGETCGTVDSVEPMRARARVAALRTADLDDVRVHVGTLEDVPREPVYDVVVVVGVLEYVGQGTLDPAPYLDFLQRCHDVLVEGGTLVVAIENALGVKYLAGAGEDHTNRPFDSLEGYLLGSPARTFSRDVLTRLLHSAGFAASVLGAFPDYKMPRVLMSDALFATSPALAERLPRFPSPDWVVPRLQLADERMLWRTLVQAKVGQDFSNSLVVIATKGEGGAPLWPQHRLAVMFSTDRQQVYCTRTEVVEAAGAVELHRSAVHPGAEGTGAAHVRQCAPPVEAERHGAEMVQVLVDEPVRTPGLLRAWAALVPDVPWAPVDLVPHNILVEQDGGLAVIDQEWEVEGYDRDCLLVRGLLWTAVGMAAASRREVHDPPRTIGQHMEELAAHLDLELTEDLLERFAAHEARFQSEVSATATRSGDRRVDAAEDVRTIMAQDVTAVRGGARFDVQWQRARDDLRHAGDVLAEKDERIGALSAEVAAVRSRLDRSIDERVRRRLGPVLRRLRRAGRGSGGRA
ncbi:hypothetical protein N866_05240 [Actinotalea ferrariae CF5-4]|uniref:Methyltransferase type 12 domain-containing protein n=1 Tax=Actinotalea ferrariae CF5-4 TaxID=948458 RepID=A0A021VXN5_9CELL|nr:methyltransferase [Actinotalea ferrariae]EYR64790.1 hypothetical protein N866_05240 [Actinotalea ferrariae CF5-4]